MKLLYHIIANIIILLHCLFDVVSAVSNVEPPVDRSKLPDVLDIQKFENPNDMGGTAIAEIIKVAIGIVGILAIIAITWAWIQLFLSAGDEEKYKKFKSMMIFALIGVAIASGAYALVTIITNLKFWA